jgi:hypothetical protein
MSVTYGAATTLAGLPVHSWTIDNIDNRFTACGYYNAADMEVLASCAGLSVTFCGPFGTYPVIVTDVSIETQVDAAVSFTAQGIFPMLSLQEPVHQPVVNPVVAAPVAGPRPRRGIALGGRF